MLAPWSCWLMHFYLWLFLYSHQFVFIFIATFNLAHSSMPERLMSKEEIYLACAALGSELPLKRCCLSWMSKEEIYLARAALGNELPLKRCCTLPSLVVGAFHFRNPKRGRNLLSCQLVKCGTKDRRCALLANFFSAEFVSKLWKNSQNWRKG